MKYSFDPAKLRPMTKVKVIGGEHSGKKGHIIGESPVKGQYYVQTDKGQQIVIHFSDLDLGEDALDEYIRKEAKNMKSGRQIPYQRL